MTSTSTSTTRSTPHAVPAPAPASPVVVRSAVLPAAALDDLRCGRTYELITRFLAEGDALREEADALSDELYRLIGETDGPGRGRLVAVRRALHNLRRPEPGSVRPGELPPALAGRVASWLARWEERENARDVLPRTLATERETALARLRDLAAHPPIRHALAHASPTLSTELEKWLAEPGRRPRRRVLTGLARYVSRAATKTSPFSTFTLVSIAEWAAAGPLLTAAPDTGEGCGAHVVLEADAGFVRLLDLGLRRRQVASGSRPVRLNPTVRFHDGSVAFTGPDPQETVREMRATGTLRAVADILRESPNSTLDALVQRLAVAGGEPTEAAHDLLERLEAIGFVEVTSGIADQAPRPLAALADEVAGDAPVSHTLHALQRELDGTADLGHGAPGAVLCEQAATSVGTLLGTLSLPGMDRADVRKHVLRESYVATSVATCGRSAWAGVLADLDLVRRWLAVHDPMLPFRLALATYVRHRFGCGEHVPLLEAHRTLSMDLHRAGGQPDEVLRVLGASFLSTPDPLGAVEEPRLREVRALREAALAAFVSREHGETSALHADPADLRAAIASWPAWVRDPGPVTCYVQPVQGTGEGRGGSLMLNSAHGGHGRGRGRWTRLLDPHRWPPREATADEPVPAELPGTFGHSVNLRAPGTSYEIEQPHAVGSLPAERRLGLDTLLVRHHPQDDLVDLWSTALRAPVIPVHGGMMSDALLPPLARLLVDGFGTTYLTHSTLPVVEAIPDHCAGGGVSYRPRVTAGRITLARARWTMPVTQVPARYAGETDADHLLRLAAWLTEHGIPHRYYARAWHRGMAREDLAFDRTHKPLYVDIANPLLVATFEKLLARSQGELELTEPLPDPATDGTTHATEFVVELSAGATGEPHDPR